MRLDGLQRFRKGFWFDFQKPIDLKAFAYGFHEEFLKSSSRHFTMFFSIFLIPILGSFWVLVVLMIKKEVKLVKILGKVYVFTMNESFIKE